MNGTTQKPPLLLSPTNQAEVHFFGKNGQLSSTEKEHVKTHPEAANLSPKETYELTKLSAEFELFKKAYKQAQMNNLVERWKNPDGTPKTFHLPN